MGTGKGRHPSSRSPCGSWSLVLLQCWASERGRICLGHWLRALCPRRVASRPRGSAPAEGAVLAVGGAGHTGGRLHCLLWT